MGTRGRGIRAGSRGRGGGQVLSLETFARHRLDGVWQKLQEYVITHEPVREIQRALARFFPDCAGAADVTPAAFDLAFDWVFCGYRTVTGETFCGRYARRGLDLTLGERELLKAWEQSAPGFFRVEKKEKGVLHLSRLPDGMPFRMTLPSGPVVCALSGQAPVRRWSGMLIGAWLMPAGGVHRCGHAVVMLPPGIEGALAHLLHVEMSFYRRQEPLGTWESFYRELWPRLLECVSVARICGEAVCGVKGPSGPPVRWDGRPLAGATAQCLEVADRITHVFHSGVFGLQEDPGAALRLWWDAAIALGLRRVDPPQWVAAILSISRRLVLGDRHLTDEDYARALGVSPLAVVRRIRQIREALQVEPADIRYIDLLNGEVRRAWQSVCYCLCGRWPEGQQGLFFGDLPGDGRK
ncbi:MAG TPA: hypothetical protein VIL07_02990 [Symbiobacteriaceae bacterium]